MTRRGRHVQRGLVSSSIANDLPPLESQLHTHRDHLLLALMTSCPCGHGVHLSQLHVTAITTYAWSTFNSVVNVFIVVGSHRCCVLLPCKSTTSFYVDCCLLVAAPALVIPQSSSVVVTHCRRLLPSSQSVCPRCLLIAVSSGEQTLPLPLPMLTTRHHHNHGRSVVPSPVPFPSLTYSPISEAAAGPMRASPLSTGSPTSAAVASSATACQSPPLASMRAQWNIRLRTARGGAGSKS